MNKFTYINGLTVCLCCGLATEQIHCDHICSPRPHVEIINHGGSNNTLPAVSIMAGTSTATASGTLVDDLKYMWDKKK